MDRLMECSVPSWTEFCDKYCPGATDVTQCQAGDTYYCCPTDDNCCTGTKTFREGDPPPATSSTFTQILTMASMATASVLPSIVATSVFSGSVLLSSTSSAATESLSSISSSTLLFSSTLSTSTLSSQISSSTQISTSVSSSASTSVLSSSTVLTSASQTSAALTITPVSVAAVANKGLSKGAKMGIAIVIAVAGFFIIFLAIVLVRRRRQVSLSNRRAEDLRQRVAGHSSTLSETTPMIMLNSPEPSREDVGSSAPDYDQGRRDVDIGQYRGIPALSFEHQDISFMSPREMPIVIQPQPSRQRNERQLSHQEPVSSTSSMFQPSPVISFSEVVESGQRSQSVGEELAIERERSNVSPLTENDREALNYSDSIISRRSQSRGRTDSRREGSEI